MPLPAYWERFTYNGNVRQEVGYQPEILDYVWQNYGGLFVISIFNNLN